MKAYCINLERRADRRSHMGQQFAAQALPVVWFPAIDGSLPEVAARTNGLSPGRSGRRLGTGAYACFQSHRAIWHELVESGASHAMIMEDDLVIAPGFSAYLRDGWVPPDADIVKVESREVRVHLDRRGMDLPDGRHLARLRSSHFGTGAYVISASAAQRLLKMTEAAVDAIDEALFDETAPLFPSLSIYQLTPAPAIQGDKLPARGEAAAAWSQTSIESRFAPGESQEAPDLSLPRRILRRLRAELRARLRGTRYVHVPFG